MEKRRKKRKTKRQENEVTSEEVISNGQFLGKHYLPQEVLIKILSDVDCKTLLICQLVCKHWKSIIQHLVWYKKAELTLNHSLNYDKKLPWTAYYCISIEMPFKKNLIKNHSGERGTDFWDVPVILGNKWTVKKIPRFLLSDKTSSLEETNFCFITSCNETWKYQIIDLVKEGFSKNLLDNFQPTIKISEWYYCEHAPVLYVCDIELIKDKSNNKSITYLERGFQTAKMIQYTFSKVIQQQDKNKWLKFEMEFKDYGKGLRYVKFTHGGKNKHHYLDEGFFKSGCKITRACVQIDLPMKKKS